MSFLDVETRDWDAVTLSALLGGLKAASDPTRLRILSLLAQGDLTVKDMTEILAQSQPRISRHLKLLAGAGLIQRFPEGAWVYYRLAEENGMAALAADLVRRLDPDDPVLARDCERLDIVKRSHAAAAQAYFARNAADWDRLRSLHVPEAAVEQAIIEALGPTRFNTLLDIGTGTGRMLELLGDLYTRAVGIDANPDMLRIARSNLDGVGLAKAQVRQGDVFDLSVAPDSQDVVIFHQVLHYLDDPARAITEARRVLAPSGRLVIVDFAPHDLEFLRENHAHRRLGFAHDQMEQWFEAAGLKPERVRDLVPSPGAEQLLTVTLWLARDERVIMADQPNVMKTLTNA